MSPRCIFCGRAFLVLAAVVVAGCGSDGPTTIPISGEVLYNGQPMKDGIVVYLPKDTSVARQATGRIQSDGSFVLTTFKKADGAVPGDYDIVVYAYQPHPGEPKTRAEHEAVARAGGIKRGLVF